MEWNETVDRHGMRQNLESWPLQIERSWKAGFEYGQTTRTEAPCVLIWAGMGGSAIGGDYSAMLAKASAPFPILVHRGGPLPAWVGEHDRIVLVSFSGNTAETLDTAAQAAERGCKIDALTSGGKLGQWCGERGITPMKVGGGRPPRTALGDLFITCLGMLAGRGWVKVTHEDATEAVTIANELTSTLGAVPSSSDHPLLDLLNFFKDRLPMIYGTGTLPAVARRCAGQFNENGKWPAHWGELPEMNHNEVVAYVPDTPWAQKAALLFFEDPDSPEEDLLRVKVTLNLAASVGLPGKSLRPVSDSPLARIIELTITADWLSYWFAIANGTDPTPIEPIDKLKAALV